MTVLKAQRSPASRSRSLRVACAGLAVGIAAALGAAHAGSPLPFAGQLAQSAGQDPAKVAPGAPHVSTNDFKRGEGGGNERWLRKR